jgi:hypothetical protein
MEEQLRTLGRVFTLLVIRLGAFKEKLLTFIEADSTRYKTGRELEGARGKLAELQGKNLVWLSNRLWHGKGTAWWRQFEYNLYLFFD